MIYEKTLKKKMKKFIHLINYGSKDNELREQGINANLLSSKRLITNG
nr:hypothetical protein [Mycoplasmopsis bovis]